MQALDASAVAGLLAAFDRELDHALERGANRLISRLNGIDKSQANRLRAEPKTKVLTLAGSEWARRAGLGAEELFYGCWDEISLRAVEWICAALVANGCEPYKARHAAVAAVAEMASQMTLHAATALQRQIVVESNGFKIPTTLVLSALAVGDLVLQG